MSGVLHWNLPASHWLMNLNSLAPDLSHIAKAASSRYGWDLSKGLDYKNDPDDQDRHMAKMVTQMAEKLVKLEEQIHELEEQIHELEEQTHELEGGRDRHSRSRIRNAFHAMTRKAKGALKRIASRETSVGPSNQEEEDSQALDMSVLEVTSMQPRRG
ncbi:hypothetical protein BHE90_010506 [Fusarium euwallaceae]|uniref:Uncharacterized protein n=1 Tax=Fusarium euwallaceae TaxID=1147111 RepID=A0A430LH64_9HYPO|nr:hypothetical protein BHE90_010506 [Fusarium euwallaceae]